VLRNPLVTIVTAAYNRANILRYAIESVRNQTYQNWHYIIVGDCCTDGTSDLIAALDDPRIEFFNFESNSGGQSAPHNYALSKVRGDYIFYLNQDDFYFPDHVASCVEFLRQSQAAMIWCPVALPLPENRNNWEQQPIILDGVSQNAQFDPDTFIIASSWAMRTATASRIGPWKSADETPVSPSQELLFRAAKAGIGIQYRPHVSVLCIHAGGRPLAYLDDDETEHRMYFNLIYEQENGIQRLMERIALTLAQRDLVRGSSRTGQLKQYCDTMVRRLLSAFGYHPASLANYVKYRKDGGFINWHRKQVLNVPSLQLGEKLLAGKSENNRYFGIGWSGAENIFRWTVGNEAKIVFCHSPGENSTKLIIRGRPITNQLVQFHIQGQSPFYHTYNDGEQSVEVPLANNSEKLIITIFLSNTVAPSSMDPSSPDSRELGFMLEELELRSGH